jgi:hypothetical protein
MRTALVVAVLIALTGAAEAKYDPCSSTGEFWLAPSGPVPRNAKVWLSYFDACSTAAWSYRVRGPGVDRIVRAPPGSLDVLDLGSLAPGATYELTLDLARYPGDVHIGTFTTTADEDHLPPVTPVFRSLAIAHLADREHGPRDDRPDDPDVWFPDGAPANDVAMDLDLSDDTVFLDITVRTETSSHHIVLWREDLPLLGRTECGPQFHLAAGAHACLSIRAIDLAGNLGAPATRCTSVVDRPGDTARTIAPMLQFPPPAPHAPAPPPGWAIGTLIAAGLAGWLVRRRAVPQ